MLTYRRENTEQSTSRSALELDREKRKRLVHRRMDSVVFD